MKTSTSGVEELFNNNYEDFVQMYKAIREFGSQSASDREQLKVYVDRRQESPSSDQVIKLRSSGVGTRRL